MHPDAWPFLIALALLAAAVVVPWIAGLWHPVRREMRHRRAARGAFPVLPADKPPAQTLK